VLRNWPREIQLSWAGAVEAKHTEAANIKMSVRIGMRIEGPVVVSVRSDNGASRKKFECGMSGRRLHPPHPEERRLKRVHAVFDAHFVRSSA
jgi:hypothetical protein